MLLLFLGQVLTLLALLRSFTTPACLGMEKCVLLGFMSIVMTHRHMEFLNQTARTSKRLSKERPESRVCAFQCVAKSSWVAQIYQTKRQDLLRASFSPPKMNILSAK